MWMWLCRVQWDWERQQRLGLGWAAEEQRLGRAAEEQRLGRAAEEQRLGRAAAAERLGRAAEEYKFGRAAERLGQAAEEHRLAWAEGWAARKVAAVQSTRPQSLFLPVPAAAPRLLKPPGETTGCCSASKSSWKETLLIPCADASAGRIWTKTCSVSKQTLTLWTA